MIILKQFALRKEWMKTFTVPAANLSSWEGHWEVYDDDPGQGGQQIGSGIGPEYPREQTALSAAIGAGIDWILDRERQLLRDQYFPDR
ncbi:hypothetical protein [Burkholderia gladioli]